MEYFNTPIFIVIYLLPGDLAKFMSWVDGARRLRVRANADTPEDCRVAMDNGAEGLGLVRTEHMFFSTPERIHAMRLMIAAEELRSPARDTALNKLQAFQQQVSAVGWWGGGL